MPDSKMTKQTEIETPALLVDLDVMEQNLAKMAQFFSNRPAKLRPHFKNHRVLELAARQMEHGAIGITCARLWQAERLAGAGIREILIANEIAGEAPVRRFVELSREVPVLVAVDNSKVVDEMSRLARDRKAELNVLVDVDLGLKRCGVQPGEPAAALAKRVVESGLKFRGLMGYEGHLQPLPPGPDKECVVREAMKALVSTKQLIESMGIPVGIVSCGGTGDYAIAGAYPGVTENQAGSYLLMDTWYTPFAPDFTVALSVLVTVISKTGSERLVVDAGCKAISGERGLPSVKGIPGLRLKALHAEHAPIEIQDPDLHVEVGDKIEIAVHYHDGTINLHKQMYGIRDSKVERVFTIEQ
ncbi:MAG TPA: DSD1 family PLP-dependent enzyme [Bryobacteraceae bacterium]|nr:DSD1 family PLP-dependent enzyme [Bryobacteraceae bacterium]